MAEYQFLAPRPLAGVDLPAEWESFKEDFDQFLLAIEKDGADDKVKLALLLRTVGERGKDIYKTLTFPTGKKKDKYADVIGQMDAFCKPRRNLFNCRDHFLTCKQNGSSVDEYLTELRKRGRHCEFGDQLDTLILHTLVLGLDDPKLVSKIKEMDNVTLDNVVSLLRRHEEASKDQTSAQNSSEASISAIHKRSHYNKPSKTSGKGKPKQSSDHKSSCSRCGGSPHRLDDCPAKGKNCSACNKPNHFAKCCRTPKPAGSKTQCSLFIGAISQATNDPSWLINVNVNDKSVPILMDTGAQCNTLPAQLVSELDLDLTPCDTKLKTYSGESVIPAGQSNAKVEVRGKTAQLEFIIVPPGCRPVIGGADCLKLGLITRPDLTPEVNTVAADKPTTVKLDAYKDLFDGLGCIDGEYSIEVNPEVSPVVHPPRRIPEPLIEDVNKELKAMLENDVIFKVDEPTDFVNSIVLVRKPDKSIRICIDPTDLNRAIKRHHHPLPTIESITARMPHAEIFSVLDAHKGFWQIKLDRKSSLLTTFNTPLGRMAFKRLPFGLKSAPEIFQAAMERLLEGLEGVSVIMDDILIYASDMTEHDSRLKAVLQRCREKGLKLNPKKSQIAVREVKYMGHILSAEGVKPDPAKVSAIEDLQPPTDVPGVRRVIGMVNYLTKFVPSLSEHIESLRKLTEKDVDFIWSHNEQQCFDRVKQLISATAVLKYYDVKKPVLISVDSSKSTIGAVLMQEGEPVAYASKSLTGAEPRWSQIEKEMRAVVFGAEHFHKYIYGRDFTIETDHKPLINISQKSLDHIPPRLLNLMWRLVPYDATLVYRRGEELYIADTLSRSTYGNLQPNGDDVMSLSVSSIEVLPVLQATDDQVIQLQSATAQDEQLKDLIETVTTGWPAKRSDLPDVLKPYWDVRDHITTLEGLIFKDQQIVVPQSMRKQILNELHQSHLGIALTTQRAREYVYWPGITANIKEIVQKCDTCNLHKREQQKETLQPTDVPNLPWQTVGMDLFQHDNHHYLSVADYYSGFIEYAKLKTQTSGKVIAHCKSIFARHGIPVKVVSDNGPCFSSREFREFAETWKFVHRTSSPHYAQSNGLAETLVSILKNLLQKADDPYLALLNYRNTPRADGVPSPAVRLFGRRTRTLLPTATSLMQPNQPLDDVPSQLDEAKSRQKAHYDKSAKDLPSLNNDEVVRYRSSEGKWFKAVVMRKLGSRSYLIKDVATSQIYRRNRRQIRQDADQSVSTADSVDDPALPDIPVGDKPPDDDQLRRSTRESRAPERYGDPVQY